MLCLVCCFLWEVSLGVPLLDSLFAWIVKMGQHMTRATDNNSGIDAFWMILSVLRIGGGISD